MENSIAESPAASHRQKYATLICCFVPSQSQHNPRRLLAQQKQTVYVSDLAVHGHKSEEPIKSCNYYPECLR